MSVINEPLRAHLLGDSSITDKVAQRVVAVGADLDLIQDAVFPYISFQRISSQRDKHLGGSSGVVNTRMQVNCWALTAAEAEDIGELVRLRLDDFRGTMTGTNDTLTVRRAVLEDDDDEPDAIGDASEGSRFRRRMDFVIIHTESLTTVS